MGREFCLDWGDVGITIKFACASISNERAECGGIETAGELGSVFAVRD